MNRRGVLGFLGKVGAVAGAGAIGAHVQAAKEFPAWVKPPKIRFTSGQVLTAKDINDLVERIERLEERLG